MQDAPDPDELLAAVAGYLREQALPQLQGQAAFHARVAANALDIVRRQLALAPGAEAAEAERLRALLGTEGSLEQLNRLLCQRIASGAMGLHAWPGRAPVARDAGQAGGRPARLRNLPPPAPCARGA
jgi:Domain of unknown function (DUF6285)